MNILGLHAAGHDTGACLISKNYLCCISEERLSRKKYEDRFPDESIAYVLEKSGLSNINQIDLIVLDCIDNNTDKSISEIKKRGFKGKIFPICHHDAHAASAFYISPFKDAAILVVDGYGSWGKDTQPGAEKHYLHTLQDGMIEVQSIYRGTENNLTMLRRTVTTDEFGMGIGTFYALATIYLGFGILEAGKLMGLSAYGINKKFFKKNVFTNFQGELLIRTGQRKFDAPEHLEYFGQKLFAGILNRKPGEPLKKGHAAIAAFVQKQTQEAMLVLANNLYDITRCPHLCIAGGVGLNCLANSIILNRAKFKKIFIQPSSSDTGIPLGCALYGYHVVYNMPRKFIMKNTFLGKNYSYKYVYDILKKCQDIKFTQPVNLLPYVAKLIAEGKIIGWFEGKSELGPRALGHRSILADPRDPEMKNKLNCYVKHRESFRPYSPAIIEEHTKKYFDLKTKSPFMLFSANVKKEKRGIIPSVTHVDGTSRVQTVNKKENKKFYNLIYNFYKITGVPVVLNTSFNINGMPIVETPEDALNCFLKTKIDFLVMEDFLVEKIK